MEWLLSKKRKLDLQKIQQIKYCWKQNDVTSANKPFSRFRSRKTTWWTLLWEYIFTSFIVFRIL